MSDESVKITEVAESPSTSEAGVSAPPETDGAKLFGSMDVFVRGGTTSWAHDQEQAKRIADAEARRRADAEERAISAVPVEDGGGKLYGGPLTPNRDVEQGYVELIYLSRNGEVRYEFGEPVRCLADVVIVDESKLELALVLVCAQCKERGVPLDSCQMKVRQSNRRWEFSQKRAGDMIPWKEDARTPEGIRTVTKIYRSAGTVVESEKFRCGQCGWECRVADNKVRPE